MFSVWARRLSGYFLILLLCIFPSQIYFVDIEIHFFVFWKFVGAEYRKNANKRSLC